jgi:hypothetical protein
VKPDQGLLPFLPGGGGATYPLPKDRLSDPCACAPGFERAVVDPQLRGLLGTNYVPIDQLKSGQANACAQTGLGPGSIAGQGLVDLTPLADAIGEAGFTLVVGGAIAGIFLLGVWRLTK